MEKLQVQLWEVSDGEKEQWGVLADCLNFPSGLVLGGVRIHVGVLSGHCYRGNSGDSLTRGNSALPGYSNWLSQKAFPTTLLQDVFCA